MNDEMISQAPEQIPDVEESPPPEKNRSEGGRSGVFLGLLVAALALALAGWQWLETHNRLSDARQEIASRLSTSDAVASESRALARQTQERLETLQNRLGTLEARLAESMSQQEALQNLYRNFARDNEESILAEVEQDVTLASRHLQLAGNIHGAIAALEVAEARLADDGRSQFIGLRKILAHDLERLRVLPQPDFAELYRHLENVIEAVDTLALATAERPGESGTPPAALPDAAPWEFSSLLSPEYWRALGLNLWGKTRALVRIQRTDRATPPVLLPPNQEFFLRENLRLRLLNARLALLSRDQWVFRKELDQARVWIERHFDGNGKNARNSLQTLGQLMDRDIRVDLPNLNESLSAIKRFRAERAH